MTEQYDNPLGIDGFEFVEFASPEPAALHALFKAMGFSPVGKHKTKNITLYRQGESNFLVNEEPDGFAADFAKQHGPCAPGFGIRVADASKACATALEKGGEAIDHKPDTVAIDVPMIKGIGGAVLYLVDKYGDKGSVYEDEFDFIDGADAHPKGYGLTFIDHLTHNVYFGNMEKVADFYENLFNFREIRYFDIKGAQTGLVSKAMTAPDEMVRIPINESSDEGSQINEYLREYKGEGIQHIALFTDNIYETIEAIRAHDIAFLDTPSTYYEVVDERIKGHREDVPRMQKNGILIDCEKDDPSKILLQIFTQNVIGPIFFEVIQRKGNEGFGEGNFQALFESIERDQVRRGVI